MTPKNLLAVSRYIKEHKLHSHFRQIYSYQENAYDFRGNIDYIIDYDKSPAVAITDTMGLTAVVTRESLNDECIKDYRNVCVEIHSTRSVSEIIAFLDKCTCDYEQYHSNANKNKLFHFIYQGSSKDGNLQFCKQIISDIESDTNRSYETFDQIFNEHRDALKIDLDRLRNIEYYRKNGFKRKKGYLFHGHPGCGKTSTVMAMANYDNRHIIEVPISRLQSTEEFEQMLSLTEINNVKFTSNQIIILFDEIDKDYDGGVNTTTVSLPPLPPLKPEKKFSLGCFLSRLDGIGSYNGIVFIATANSIEKFDAALYRHGRLDLVVFDYIRQIDIVNMIEQYYDGVKLDDDQIKRLPDRCHKIAPATVRKTIEAAKDCTTLIRQLHDMICKIK